jgi:deoxycytidine triphosphate deaminase
MILPSQEIKRLSTKREHDPLTLILISPFDESNLRGSSYDLTVGEEYYIGQDGASSALSTERLKPKQSFTIPPHAVCFILTTETIELPKDVTARVSLRMTHIYAGMVLTSQPPFDPGYKGRVIVMLHNLSSEPFHLKCGERLATIEFACLSKECEDAKVHRSVKSLEEQLPKPLVSSLSEIASRSAAAYNKVLWLSGQMLVFVALVVAVLAVPGFFSFNSLLDRLGEQKEQLKEMSQMLANYKLELEQSKLTTQKLEKQLVVIAQMHEALAAGVPTSQRATGSGKP